jgi:putative PIN family toxin of toxin-antitoxin system
MIRVVIDTNIIVSALLQPLGPPAQVYSLVCDGSIQLCVSGEVYAGYEEVIRRPRFRRDETVIAAALYTIRRRGLWVKPTETVRECADPDDDIFLECAQAARAVLSGDRQPQTLPCYLARRPDDHGAELLGDHGRPKPNRRAAPTTDGRHNPDTDTPEAGKTSSRCRCPFLVEIDSTLWAFRVLPGSACSGCSPVPRRWAANP